MVWFLKPTSTFKHRYKRKRPSEQIKIDDVLRALSHDENPDIFCRKKYGRLEGCYGYDLNDDSRILMRFNKEQKEIELLRVCTHKQVYGYAV